MSQAGNLVPFSLPPGSVVEKLSGNTGGPVSPDSSDNINVVGDGTTITVAGNPGTNTLTISALSAGAASFPTDSGTATPTVGVLNIIADTAALNAGSSVSFSGAGNTVTLNVTDVNGNTLIGNSAGNATISGGSGGTGNTALGTSAGAALTTSFANVAIGEGALTALTTGERNTAIGFIAGLNYTGNETSNILIGSNVTGVNTESNTLRISTGSGTGAGQVNRCFIGGIDAVNVGSTIRIVTEGSDQLGTADLTDGTGINITPTANVITISSDGTTTLNYRSINSTPALVVPSTDNYLSVNSTSAAITIEFPNAATLGRTYIVKDRTGNASVNNITITTVGGAVNIDGATTFVMNTNFQAISLIGNGTSYELF